MSLKSLPSASPAPPAPATRARRFLLRAVGVGSSAALLGTAACGGTTAGPGAGTTVHDASSDGVGMGLMGTAPSNIDAGLVTGDAGMLMGKVAPDAGPDAPFLMGSGAVAQDAGVAPQDGGFVGDSVGEAGPG